MGALEVLLPALAERGAPPRLLVGTSAGALLTGTLAATAHLEPEAQAAHLKSALGRATKQHVMRPLWRRVPEVLARYTSETLGLSFFRLRGLFGTQPLAQTLATSIDWEAVIGLLEGVNTLAVMQLLILPGRQLFVCDTHEAQLAKLGARHAFREADAAAREAEAVIVAVKPQQFTALAGSLKTPLGGKLVISVMAGVTLANVAKALGAVAVVRCMPNLGAQVGRGATAWIAARDCSPAQVELARDIFRATGIEIEVSDESLLDALTALGGTGPAYFFYLTELLAENAQAMGFSAEQSSVLAHEVLSASARLLEMEPPSVFESERVRDEKVKVRSIRPFSVDSLQDILVLGQYGEGMVNGQKAAAYRDEPGVSPDSMTPTYAALKLYIDNWRWNGVPFYLRSGKRLAKKKAEISIHYRSVPHLMFSPPNAGGYRTEHARHTHSA